MERTDSGAAGVNLSPYAYETGLLIQRYADLLPPGVDMNRVVADVSTHSITCHTPAPTLHVMEDEYRLTVHMCGWFRWEPRW